MTRRKRRIAVVGAGIAGLTAAWRLNQADFDCIVCEAEHQPGGRSRSILDGGAIHDLGAWTFTADSPMSWLAREVNLPGDLVTLQSTIGRPVDGKLKRGNLRNPTSLVGSVFTLRESLALVLSLIMSRSFPQNRPDESAALWADRYFSAEFTRDVLEPLAALYFLQSLSTLSRNALLSTIRYLSKIQLQTFKGGMGHLSSFLASQLTVYTDARIQKVELTDKKILLVGDSFREEVDGLVLAVPLPETVRLLEGFLDRSVVNHMAARKYASALVVRLLLRGRWPQIALQVIPPRGQGMLSCGFAIERAKHNDRVPAGHELVTMFAKPERVGELAGRSDPELASMFAGELAGWLGLPSERIERFWVTRWKTAAAFCDPEAPQRVSALRKSFGGLLLTAPIWVAGDFLGSSSLSGAVSSGKEAARSCIDHFYGS